jgi:hypothetical protein
LLEIALTIGPPFWLATLTVMRLSVG